MHNHLILFAIISSLLGSGCASDDGGQRLGRYSISFKQSDQGWQSGFADYPQTESAAMQLQAALPPPLDAQTGGIQLSGKNASDGLFMFIKAQLQGLQADTHYKIGFRVTLASNAPIGCIGTGGAPAESVYLKAGATREEPLALADAQGWLRMNIDQGIQANSGRDAIVLGHIGTSQTDCFNPQYEIIQRRSDPEAFQRRTDAGGRLWLLVGVDSGFESTTTVYVTGLHLELIPQK